MLLSTGMYASTSSSASCAIAYLPRISSRSIASARSRSIAGSLTSSRPGARIPRMDDSAVQASSVFFARTVHRVARIVPSVASGLAADASRNGAVTFSRVSAGSLALVMSPSAISPANRAVLGPPAATSSGILWAGAVQPCRLGPVVLAVEVQFLAVEQAPDDAQSLAHPRHSLGIAGKSPAERAVVDSFPSTESEPAAREPVHGGGGLGDECRVIVEQRACHGGTELDFARPGCYGPAP